MTAQRDLRALEIWASMGTVIGLEAAVPDHPGIPYLEQRLRREIAAFAAERGLTWSEAYEVVRHEAHSALGLPPQEEEPAKPRRRRGRRGGRRERARQERRTERGMLTARFIQVSGELLRLQSVSASTEEVDLVKAELRTLRETLMQRYRFTAPEQLTEVVEAALRGTLAQQ
jgi:hypothetical protein